MFFNFEDAEYLFNWAFNHFSYQTVLADTAELGEIPVELAEGNDYVLAKPKNEVSILWYDEVDISTINKSNIVWYYDKLNAPVNKGDVLGEVTLTYSGEELATVELVAVSDVKKSFLKYNAYALTMFPKSSWFKTAFMISFLLCALYIIVCIYSWIVFKNKQKPIKPKYAVPKVKKDKK
jgi:D-alanyl-D-alanine carboxypeptidase (penicillin-binding protein 5/6)